MNVMNNKQLEIALEIATLAHKGVVRRNGDPYIFHPLRVCNNKTYIQTKLQKTAAILHDVIEDTPFTTQFLIEKGITKEVIDVLQLLTHNKETTTYEDYIDNVCNNVDAMLVKLSDLTDNLDQGTLPTITDKDRERFITYENARLKIMSRLASDYPDIFKHIMTTK